MVLKEGWSLLGFSVSVFTVFSQDSSYTVTCVDISVYMACFVGKDCLQYYCLAVLN